MNHEREQWGTRLGLILAVAGNAIGLGNFLRFPVQAAQNGGGDFMIPYLLAFVTLGIPLMWLEWNMGRFGGRYGHGTTVGSFFRMTKSHLPKYFGVLGVFLPLIIIMYYVYVESWCLGFSIFSIKGSFIGIESRDAMGSFFEQYLGLASGEQFSSITTSYIIFLLTFALNIFVLLHGIRGGIEKLARFAMPLLFIMATVLVIRVLTLGTPDPTHPENSVINGLAFLWNPDFSVLGHPAVWVAAAGQIFFTLSVGTGSIQCYASYIKKDDDICLTGLTTAMTNGFCEVILGSTIAIPIAFAFFGAAETVAIAKGGSFSLGFFSLPVIFNQIPAGYFFGFLWFVLLFFAGITSSVAISQPAVAFLQDELRFSRKKAVAIVGALIFLGANFVIFGMSGGFMDELDFWVGTLGLAFFALIEAIIFAWIFGMDKVWADFQRGAELKIPRVFYYLIKYFVPLALAVLLGWWTVTNGLDILVMKGSEMLTDKSADKAAVVELAAGNYTFKFKGQGKVTLDGIPDGLQQITAETTFNLEETKKITFTPDGDVSGWQLIKELPASTKLVRWGARAFMLAVLLLLLGLTWYGFRNRKPGIPEDGETSPKEGSA